MKNLILSIGDILPYAIVLAVMVIIAIVLAIVISKANDPKRIGKKQKTIEDVDTKKSMALKIPFLSNSEDNFFRSFQNVLPDEYAVYPKVSMEQIVVPYNNREFYDIVKYKRLDFVVFLRRNMQPVVVVDLHDRTGVQKSIKDDEKFLAAALQNVGLSVVDYEIKQEYNPAELLSKFLDALDPLAIANLKKNRDRYGN